MPGKFGFRKVFGFKDIESIPEFETQSNQAMHEMYGSVIAALKERKSSNVSIVAPAQIEEPDF